MIKTIFGWTILLSAAVFLCACGKQRGVLYEALEDRQEAEKTPVPEEAADGADPDDGTFRDAENVPDGPDETEAREDTVVVDVCGAVNAPGVYTLPAGSRVYEAIALAGGFADDAEGRMINRALVLSDGQQIVVPTKEEAQDALSFPVPDTFPDGGEKDGKVDLNKADEAALTALPGIGPSRAAAIISYREEHGAFSEIEEVMEVSGIGPSLFGSIRDRITVGKE